MNTSVTVGPSLALDIGATKLGAALVFGDGSASGWTTIPTHREQGPALIIGRLQQLGADVAAHSPHPISSVGISCGGPLDRDLGLLRGPLHLPGWDDVPIVHIMEERFGVPGILVNDASAGAWAEFSCGAAIGSRSMLYLTVSSGMGGGAVIDGELLSGARGNAGEFGHVLWQRGGRRCTCGRQGCAEAYAAGTQIAERAREAMALGRTTSLVTEPDVTAAVVARHRDRDQLSAELWDDAMEALGSAVTDVVNVFEPDCVVIGGGLTRSGNALFDPVRAIVSRDAMRRPGLHLEVLSARLGPAVCAIGAGLLAHASVRRSPSTREGMHV